MSVWIEIKFAPRDGTKVDLWGTQPGGELFDRWTDCHWFEGQWWQVRGRFSQVVVPTHFMPIGPGPNVAAEPKPHVYGARGYCTFCAGTAAENAALGEPNVCKSRGGGEKPFDWAALARLRKTEGEY